MADYLMENQTLEFEDKGAFRSITIADDRIFPLTVGNKYTVVWDGVPYTCFAGGIGLAAYLGNERVTSSGSVDTGEPFCVHYYISSNELTIHTLSEESTHVVSVYRNEDQSGYLVTDNTVAFSLDSSYGMYLWQVAADEIYFGLIPDENYTVVWDGTRYFATAVETSLGTATGIALGNLGLFGLGDDNGQPFLFAYSPTSTGSMGTTMCYTTEVSDTHTFSVYRGELTASDDSGEEVGKVIFAETAITFRKNTNDDIYCSIAEQERQKIALETGKTYTVVWDGVEYVCAAEAGEIYGYAAVFAGNKSIDPEMFPDGTDTKEPFLIGYASEIPTDLVETLQTSETHTVAVYEGDITSGGGGGTEDGYLLKDAELAFELETNSETHYFNNEAVVAISVGKTYTVIWDGKYYDCTAKEYTAVDEDTTITLVALGNLNIRDSAEENTHEPFVYLYLKLDGASGASFVTMETDASHVISIYDGVLEHPAVTYADIYTYDKDGKAVLHEKRSSVTFDTPDGRYAVFKLSHIADSRS